MSRGLLAPAAALLVLAGCTTGGVRAEPGGEAPSPTVSPSPYVPPALELQRLGGFSSPVWAAPVPGDPAHLLLAERTGRVWLLDADGTRQKVVLDLSPAISKGAEQGVLSLAFDPAYTRNARLYVHFTNRDADTRLFAYTVRDGVARDPELLYLLAQPYPNHKGGQILFDRTGMLLLALGDGGSAADPEHRAQDLSSDLGKILRLDPRTGEAAPGNPYPQNPRVWALGLRNPWRFSFGPDGALYLGDIGQTRVEELNVVPPAWQRGANYGWSVYEGREPFKPEQGFTEGGPVITPALTYPHIDGGCSITAGQVYGGSALPELAGSYVFGDYCVGSLWAVDRTADGGVTPLRDLDVRVDGLQAFGTDANGELLVMSAEGLFRLTRP